MTYLAALLALFLNTAEDYVILTLLFKADLLTVLLLILLADFPFLNLDTLLVAFLTALFALFTFLYALFTLPPAFATLATFL